MTTTAAPNIVERVRKLLALANSTNPNEASSAASAAHKLMKEHKISRSDIDDTLPSAVGEYPVPGSFADAWRIALLTSISKTYYCTMIRISDFSEKGAEIWTGAVIGRKQDADIIVYLFSYYEKEMDIAVRENGYNMRSKPEEENFRRGIVYTLQARIMERKKTRVATPQDEQKKALVLTQRADKEEAKTYMNKKYNKPTVFTPEYNQHTTAFYQGIHAGQAIVMPTYDSEQPRIPKKKPKKD